MTSGGGEGSDLFIAKQDRKSGFNPNSTASSWSKLKDPRIVRVSRAFGGKDRHSKVCTVRGLRDRRVRLSVQTAIQVYDLQDRLGLSQPSKVVDWLLNAAKHEIDELPPLQIPQGSSFFQSLDQLSSQHHEVIDSASNLNPDLDFFRNEAEKQIATSAFNPFVRWDPSNLTLSHPPRSYEFPSENHQDMHNISGVVQWPSSSHVYQHGIGLPWFPSPQFDSKSINLQVDSSSRSLRPFNFNMTANLLHFHNKNVDNNNDYSSS